MADENRIMFPDEVEKVKAEAAEKDAKTENKNDEVESPEETPGIQSRNMITVPANCPPGYQRGADGVCREVF